MRVTIIGASCIAIMVVWSANVFTIVNADVGRSDMYSSREPRILPCGTPEWIR